MAEHKSTITFEDIPLTEARTMGRGPRMDPELGIPVTIRKVPGGLLFWRSTAEDLAQAKEVAQRLQPAQRQGRVRPSQRRR
jgi:hypothetical protein